MIHGARLSVILTLPSVMPAKLLALLRKQSLSIVHWELNSSLSMLSWYQIQLQKQSQHKQD